jgi:hypothetical protein
MAHISDLKNTPAHIKLGEVIQHKAQGNRIELWVESVELCGKFNSERISFEVTKLIDYNIVLNKKHEEQIRPKARFLFISGIHVQMTQN